MSELVDGTPSVVLAVYAHPDDADVACGGTLARWARRGSEVHVLVCTDGGKGTADPEVAPGELARRRAEELAAFGAIKRALDPDGIMNPHVLTVPPGEHPASPQR